MSSRYIVPGLTLFTILGLLGIFAVRANRQLQIGKAQYEAAQIQFENSREDVQRRTTTLAGMRQAATPGNRFVDRWAHAMEGERDGSAILLDMSKFANEHTVSVQDRKSGPMEYSWEGGKHVKVQTAEGIGVSSEYYRLINWMGAVEQAWPLARFETVTFEQKGSSLQLLLRLSYPTFLVENSK